MTRLIFKVGDHVGYVSPYRRGVFPAVIVAVNKQSADLIVDIPGMCSSMKDGKLPVKLKNISLKRIVVECEKNGRSQDCVLAT
jgi:hypothetical protein